MCEKPISLSRNLKTKTSYNRIARSIRSPSNCSAYDRILNKARELYIKRQATYGDSWRIVRSTTLIDLARMKLNRTLTQNNDKVYDELVDSINYLVFAYLKREEEELEKRENMKKR